MLFEKTITREVNPQDENERIFEAYQKSILNEANYDLTFLDGKGEVIYSGAKSGIGINAKNTNDAVKKAKENMKDFPGAKKVRLSVVRGKTASRVGEFNLNEDINEEILAEATEEAKIIRDEIKKRFKLTNRDVSVKAHNYSMGSSVRAEIKSAKALPFMKKIKEIGSGQERYQRDQVTGDILKGGNTFVFVEIDWKFRDKLIKKIEMELLKKVTGDYMNDIGTNVIKVYGGYGMVKTKDKKEFWVSNPKTNTVGRTYFSVMEVAGGILSAMLDNGDENALKKIK